jgi:colanic acid biosynthesis glycosyl transferase WcaI
LRDAFEASARKEAGNSSLNVLIIAQYFPPDLGGSASRAYNVAKALRLNGCNVTVVAAFPHYPYGKSSKGYRLMPLKMEQLEHVKVLRTFILPLASKGFARRVMLILSFAVSSLFALPFVGDVDVIWATSWVPATIFGVVKGRPVALNVDDLTLEDLRGLQLVEDDSLVLRMATLIYRVFYSKGKAVTPISPGYVETIVRKYGVEGNRVHVVEVGVDPLLFRDKAQKQSVTNRFRVVYAGVLGVGYDFEQIFEAAKLLAETDVDVEFVLHGGGECVEEMRSRISALGLSNVVLSDRLLPDREGVVQLLGSADALILPLKHYDEPYPGLPSKLYEYQAVGKPIICCAEGQPAEYVEKTESGVVVQPGDFKGLAEAVVFLKENNAMARTMGENGRKYVENNLSLQVLGLKMERILRGLT